MARKIVISLILATIGLANAQTPGSRNAFSAHPYMGWSSWSLYRENVSEKVVLAQAGALKASGLQAAGYRYVNIDDGWTDGWDENGLPKTNRERFPSGMDGLARKLHSQGFLFGIYLNPGIRAELYEANPVIAGTKIHIREITDTTHAGSTRDPRRANPRIHAYRIDFTKPGAAAYVESEVAELDRWGVDFVKLDFVGPGGGDVPSDNREELRQWHRAILHAHRSIWLELSNFASLDQARLWRETANGWRIENDIECYGCGDPNSPAHGNLTEWPHVVDRFTDVRPWAQHAGPGGWNDLDSLELGNGDHDGITPDERVSMFTLWAISCAPLYFGSDLTQLDPADLALISNREIIAIDQAGKPATPVDLPSWRRMPKQQLWMTRYADGSVVLAVFNLDDNTAPIKLSLEELDSLRDTHMAANPMAVFKDVAHGGRVEATAGKLEFDLAPHASRLLRFTAKP